MSEKCIDGLYDDNIQKDKSYTPYELMMKDFDLLINNALKYNMPKDQPHYQARLLNVMGKFTFHRLRDII